jgi:hypothetical protein
MLDKPMLDTKNTQFQVRSGLSEVTIAQVCQQWGILELGVFGSVLREDFRLDSDIDFLLTFKPNVPQGLMTLVEVKNVLEQLTGRSIDLVLRQSVEQSDNWIRRQEILNTVQVLYGSR